MDCAVELLVMAMTKATWLSCVRMKTVIVRIHCTPLVRNIDPTTFVRGIETHMFMCHKLIMAPLHLGHGDYDCPGVASSWRVQCRHDFWSNSPPSLQTHLYIKERTSYISRHPTQIERTDTTTRLHAQWKQICASTTLPGNDDRDHHGKPRRDHWYHHGM